jgi:hypothetical protein
MTQISPYAPSAPPAQTGPSRAAWREEMLGEFLQQMRERQLPEEAENPPAAVKNAIKGQYLNVYV